MKLAIPYRILTTNSLQRAILLAASHHQTAWLAWLPALPPRGH